MNRNFIVRQLTLFAWIFTFFVFFDMTFKYFFPSPKQSTTPVETAAPTLLVSNTIAALNESKTVTFEDSHIKGNLSVLKGGVFTDLLLKNYTVEQNKTELVKLLGVSPAQQLTLPKQHLTGELFAPYFQYSTYSVNRQPIQDNAWKLQSSNNNEFVLTYEDANLSIQRTIRLTDKFLWSIEDSVNNKTQSALNLERSIVIEKHLPFVNQNSFISHEGVVGGNDQHIIEAKYSGLDSTPLSESINKGFMGFSEKYWMTTAIINEPTVATTATAKKYTEEGSGYYQLTLSTPFTLNSNQTSQYRYQLFTGSKEHELLTRYQQEHHIQFFSDTIDWGWFWFFTKPMSTLLLILYHYLGNFGLAIIALTLIVKIALFWPSYKSSLSMAKMQEFQPHFKKIQELYKDNPELLRQKTLELYKKHQINPAGGCLMLIVTMPIYFALYKILSVGIEIRHANFVGWITDLSAPDPTTFINLFGLLPFTPPHLGIFHIGVWPILMAISLFLQQKTSTQAITDPVQKRVMQLFPLMFLFISSGIASGLVIYWTLNNLLTVAQQQFINNLNARKKSTNQKKA